MIPIDPRVPLTLVPAGSRAVVIAESQQDQYQPLPSVVTPGRVVITRWTLTAEERRAVLRGDDVYVTIWGTPIRPVLVTVGPIDWTAL